MLCIGDLFASLSGRAPALIEPHSTAAASRRRRRPPALVLEPAAAERLGALLLVLAAQPAPGGAAAAKLSVAGAASLSLERATGRGAHASTLATLATAWALLAVHKNPAVAEQAGEP